MSLVRLHYWAGARTAAGVESEEYAVPSIAAAVQQAVQSRGGDAGFTRILAGSTLLRDGQVVHEQERDRPLSEDVTIEVLPPFAGG